MNVVSNTGPLIALAKADSLEILSELYQQVKIPTTVYQELSVKRDLVTEIERIEAAISRSVLQVIDRQTPSMLFHPPEPEVERRTRHLGPGEREAIGLVYQLRGFLEFQPLPLLLIDDKAGRRTATELGVTVKGVVGILLQAKADGHLTKVGPVLRTIRQNGYWISDATLRSALELSGEIGP